MTTRYIVFDCTAAIGHACETRFAFTAHAAAWFLTIWTGRTHDYAGGPS